MGITRYFGVYALVRGTLYFIVGASAIVFGVGGVATGSLASLGGVVFGALYIAIAFALFFSGGLLTMKRKIGRLLAMLLLSVDALFQGFEAFVGGSFLSGLFAACSLGIVVYLFVANPLASGEGRTIDEESNAHGIGIDEF
jgi:hypothetical protein